MFYHLNPYQEAEADSEKSSHKHSNMSKLKDFNNLSAWRHLNTVQSQTWDHFLLDIYLWQIRARKYKGF
jgi:hypothetical protein